MGKGQRPEDSADEHFGVVQSGIPHRQWPFILNKHVQLFLHLVGFLVIIFGAAAAANGKVATDAWGLGSKRATFTEYREQASDAFLQRFNINNSNTIHNTRSLNSQVCGPCTMRDEPTKYTT